AELLVISADAGDKTQMSRAIESIRERFGPLNGVIHGAGSPRTNGVCPIQEITREQCEGQFQAKVHGTLVLEKVLLGENLDFCLMLSSLSSILGGLGYAAYSAANIFMDAFVNEQNRAHSTPWLSVNWDGWQLEDDDTHARSALGDLAITADEGADAFERIISSRPSTQLIVSTGNLDSRISQWINRRSTGRDRAGNAAPAALHSRPELGNSYVAPTNEIEEKVVAIWQELLGIERIGINDDFFDLG